LKHAIYLFVFFASVINVPATLTPQSGSSRATAKDPKVSWTSEWGMELTEFEGKKAARFTEKGSGRLSSFSQEVRWSSEAVWLADNAFLPVDIEKTVTSADGTPLLVERKHFDREKGTVLFERRKGGARPESKTLDVPADTLAIEGLAGVLRFVSVDKDHPFSAHVLTNEPHVYSVNFEWRGTERIETAAGTFECYKVEMIPNLGVLNLIRPFLAKTSFWFTVAAPHYWVRYEGPESGPRTPDVVLELSESAH